MGHRPLPNTKAAYTRPHRGNGADDLMAGDHGSLGMGQLAVNQMQVGAADAAGMDVDQQLARCGDRVRNLQVAQLSVGAVEYHCTHVTSPLRDACHRHGHGKRAAPPCRVPA
jgi:hypothetical protein